MKGLIAILFAILAVATAAPSGLGLGLGWGLGAPGAVLIPPSASAVITKPVLGWGLAPAIAAQIAPVAIAAPVAAPIIAPAVAPAAAVAITNGGGTIGVSGHGAIVSGPKTAPVVIEGPSGVVKADGLWGPTLAGVAVPAGHGW
ncbi:unnamed protein product [Psylliodes chrysocephalus]|uniref:Uncharacterized protein n=1 Tax=Psylliodes chrysocephalus TaxID=3402493 RepID=A0A9P0GAJ5_9CUCU|nr:unnamed protein product [Psylliodes chrysocephala]